jgi:protein-L-isoaspartate(D-aspartate) O-methyltransferase
MDGAGSRLAGDVMPPKPVRSMPAPWMPVARSSLTRSLVAPAPPGGLGLAGDSARRRMIDTLRQSGVRDVRVLAAMQAVPRHAFVEPALASRAYEDVALPIGHGQTISRPSTVARMLETLLAVCPGAQRAESRALEIGTGCGYQAAVMAALFGEVVSIERVRGLHDTARANLRPLRLANLRLMFGDGRLGAPQLAPFDSIIVAAAGQQIPDDLLNQMKVGALLLAPVGDDTHQALHRVERTGAHDWQVTVLDAARFVPLRIGTI